jgi:Ca2+-transporting ATPase
VLGGATLGVIGWADDHYGSSAIARTMGLTTFAISNVFFSLTTRDERRSVFSLDVLGDKTFLLCTGGSIAAIVLGTELGIIQRVLHTVHLTGQQWLVCIVVGLAIVPVSEARRLLLQRRGSAAGATREHSDGVEAVSTSP